MVDITNNFCTEQGHLGQKSTAYDQVQFQIKSGLLWRVYDTYLLEKEYCDIKKKKLGNNNFRQSKARLRHTIHLTNFVSFVVSFNLSIKGSKIGLSIYFK